MNLGDENSWIGRVEFVYREAGVLIECAPLRPWSSATTVRVRDGETLLTDGPAAEIKEQFGGWTRHPLTDASPEIITIARRE